MEKISEFYLDSNVLINAAINDTIVGDKARDIISAVQTSKIQAFTSCLTIDELIWIIRKYKPKESAVEICKIFLDSNVRFLEVNKDIINVSLDIMNEFNLKPRDAIHLATMKIHNLKNLISDDTDFNKIDWINKISIKQFQL